MAISRAEETNHPTMIIGWASENRTRRAIFSDRNRLAIKADASEIALTEITLEKKSLAAYFVKFYLKRRTISDQQRSDTHFGHLASFAMVVLDNIR
jgi:hypothetical protein